MIRIIPNSVFPGIKDIPPEITKKQLENSVIVPFTGAVTKVSESI
jgi:hypothetical protein